jgi:hypothetical protein
MSPVVVDTVAKAILDDIEDRREGLPFDRSRLSADLDQRRADIESRLRLRRRRGRRRQWQPLRPSMPESRIQGPETSSRFRENEARLEAAATTHDWGNECQAAADLLHDAVDNGEPKAATRADRTSTNEGLLQSFEGL